MIHEHELCMTQYVRGAVSRVRQPGRQCVQCCGAVPVLSSISIIYDGRDLRSSAAARPGQSMCQGGGRGGGARPGR